jgi:hypothetical protein
LRKTPNGDVGKTPLLRLAAENSPLSAIAQ